MILTKGRCDPPFLSQLGFGEGVRGWWVGVLGFLDTLELVGEGRVGGGGDRCPRGSRYSRVGGGRDFGGGVDRCPRFSRGSRVGGGREFRGGVDRCSRFSRWFRVGV